MFSTELLSVSVTDLPPAGAADDSVTFPVVDWPPSTVEGVTVRLIRAAGGKSVRVAVFVTPPWLQLKVATWTEATAEVDMGKEVLLEPDKTWANDWLEALARLSVMVTSRGPPEAFAFSVMKPVLPFPPRTVEGEIVKFDNLGSAVRFSKAVFVSPVRVAKTLRVALKATWLVVTRNVAVADPSGTSTFGCVWTTLELVLSVTNTPPGAAGPHSVTVPTVLSPPEIGFGLKVRLLRPGRSNTLTVLDTTPSEAVTWRVAGEPMWPTLTGKVVCD